MISFLGLETLQTRHLEKRLKLLYLIYNDLNHLKQCPYVTRVSRANTHFNNGKMIREFRVHNDTFKFSFFPRTITAWNQLPKDVVESASVEEFISKLKVVLM
ncbi:unnamed protein product [Ixodes persulcatus]